MMKISRKLGAMLSALALSMTLIPAVAFADDGAHPSPTDASTRIGLENYSPFESGLLSAYSLGSTRVTAKDVIAFGERYIGMPYVWGGKNPNRDGGLDCSGFVTWVFNNVCGTSLDGYGVPADGLYKRCTPISRQEAKPGDLVFFYGTYGRPDFISHVGIFTGGNVMLDAGNPIGYDNIDLVRCHGIAFGRLVDLDQKKIDIASSGVAIHIANKAEGTSIPKVSVTSLGTLLREGVDYRLYRSGNSVTIKGIGSCTGTRTQSYVTYKAPSISGVHSLRMAHAANAVLDITNGSRDAGAFAQFWEPNHTQAQGFLFEQQPDKRYKITNIKSGLALSVDATTLTVGNDARIVQKPWTADASQLWDVRPSGAGYAITSALDGRLALDVQNAHTSNGTRVQLWEYNGSPAQTWVIDSF